MLLMKKYCNFFLESKSNRKKNIKINQENKQRKTKQSKHACVSGQVFHKKIFFGNNNKITINFGENI